MPLPAFIAALPAIAKGVSAVTGAGAMIGGGIQDKKNRRLQERAMQQRHEQWLKDYLLRKQEQMMVQNEMRRRLRAPRDLARGLFGG